MGGGGEGGQGRGWFLARGGGFEAGEEKGWWF